MKTIRVFLVAGLLLAAAPVWSQNPPDPATMDDEQFLDFLDLATLDAGEDRIASSQRRLSKLLFSIAATLGGGKTNVRLLQGAVHVREPASDSVREMFLARYADYAAKVDRLRAGVSALLDAPDSIPLLYRALTEGHQVCWRLDAYTRLAETYGVSVNDLVSILASRESCAQFRRAAFSPLVDGVVARALEESGRHGAEIETLQDEISDLERLVEDLREIEGRD